MSTVAGAPDFVPALGDLQDHLPFWWRTQDPTSQLYKLLVGFATIIDELSVLWEQPYLDQVLDTASEYGLLHNFAFAWGVENEQLPTVLTQLAAYIQTLAADNGSPQALLNTLNSLLLTPVNLQGGTVLTFPAGGGGLTFPANGSGLTLYEFAPGALPGLALIFPPDGSGLTFPATGTPLEFTSFAFINLLPNYAAHQLTVQVLDWLSFDRPSFARAVARANPADWYPPIVQEVSTL